LTSGTPISDKYLEQYQFAERARQFTVNNVPLKSRTSTVVADALQEVLDREISVDIHHCPSVLQSDNEFDNDEFKQLCDKYGIKQEAAKSKIEADKAQFPRLARFNTVRVQLASIDVAIRAQIKSANQRANLSKVATN